MLLVLDGSLIVHYNSSTNELIDAELLDVRIEVTYLRLFVIYTHAHFFFSPTIFSKSGCGMQKALSSTVSICHVNFKSVTWTENSRFYVAQSDGEYSEFSTKPLNRKLAPSIFGPYPCTPILKVILAKTRRYLKILHWFFYFDCFLEIPNQLC